MKTTIKDVADLAGVSFKTVSRVINNEGSVKPDTLEKVKKAIQQLNYHPNNAARNLAGSKAFSLGFIYNNPNAYYVIDMQNGILDECKERGYELLIHPCESVSESMIEEIRQMVKRSQLSGLIICPPLSESPDMMDQLADLDIQFIRIVSGSDESNLTSPCVLIHDREASDEITEHLISLNHEKIGFISGEQIHKSTIERYQGYLAAMQRHNLEVDPDWIVEGQYSFDSGVKGAQKLLSLDNPPTAIFACNDEIAAGALFAARLSGVEVPNQLSIAGFEDSPFSRQTIPKLTTAAQPTREIARQATRFLIQNVVAQRQQSTAKSLNHQHYQPSLVLRDSTSQFHKA
ncbi:LacI family DNA-binding transcriptional regulator [Aliiglaciecola lipolytica]|uniref:LacI family transcriptional regulator n=1 Tax=Aliiglaciecola lipolytica E3 TaxID=1127673 RepID=K6YZE6_9ALTE|nr:LacI family DNA-binding transcriptional regulator [Aliiglaciecola lipolytica]GAC16590.1 LacI family transcriptional regulator [Aliiglaciecola lipolytica E3]